MGIRDEGCEFDLSGLPVFYVNKYFSKTLDDGTVLSVSGLRNGNSFTPILAIISPASIAIEDGTQYIDAAKSVLKAAH